MSINIYQVQNVLRTYHDILRFRSGNTESTSEDSDSKKVKTALRAVSAKDRVTISDESKRRLSESPPTTHREAEGWKTQEGAGEEETFAQS